ncbi:hypothetical protein LCGC14_1682690, partial [marine sediment metagenome]
PVSRSTDLAQLIQEVPRKSVEQMEAERLVELRKSKEARRGKRKTFTKLFGIEVEDDEDDVDRMSPKDVKLNHIYNNDCIEQLKLFPDNFFHACITDPPYNLGKKYKSGIDDKKRAGDYYEWCYQWIDEVVRTLTPNGQFFIALWDTFKHHIKVYIEENHANKLRFIQEIAWKTTGVPRPGSGKLRSDITAWLHFGPSIKKGEPRVNYTYNLNEVRSWKFVKHGKNALNANRKYVHPLGKDPSTLMEFYHDGKDGKNENEFKDVGSNFYVLNWMRKFLENMADYSIEHAIELFDMPTNIIDQRTLPTTHKDRLDHPCQMPVELPMQLIKLSTKVGDRILEPFCGTGTTGHAATVLGRNCTAIELSPDYVHMANGRLNRATLKDKAAIEYWNGQTPSWTMDECTPLFDDSRQKSLIDFFAVGAVGAKRLGDDLVTDVVKELSGDLNAILGF